MSVVSTAENKVLTLIALVRTQTWYQKSTRLSTKPLVPIIGQKEAEQLVKYGLVGAVGMLIELTTLNILIFILGWSGDYEKVAANLLAVGLAIASNFVWNRLWTFPDARHQNKRLQFLQFAGVSFVGMVFNSVVFFTVDQFLLSLAIPQLYAVQLAKLSAILLVFCWNFLMNRLWTFRSRTVPRGTTPGG